MSVHVVQENGGARVTIQGDMTIYQAAELKPALLAGLEGAQDIELNLSEVSDMDTAGFQLLLMLKREASHLGKTLRMVAHSPATLEVMDAYRMGSYFGDPIIITQ